MAIRVLFPESHAEVPIHESAVIWRHDSPSPRRFYWAAWLWQDSSYCEASLMAQWVKNLPANQETQEMWVRSLGGEDPLEKETAIHSSILARISPETEEPGGLQSLGSQRVRYEGAHLLLFSFPKRLY